jgi:hypothetical protein
MLDSTQMSESSIRETPVPWMTLSHDACGNAHPSQQRSFDVATIQSQFEQFNNRIRLGRLDENAILREKRNIIRDKLETRLPEVFATHKETCPNFISWTKGSYAMNTGIKPLDGDFDIDQGLYFEISIDAYPDPVVLKERVGCNNVQAKCVYYV